MSDKSQVKISFFTKEDDESLHITDAPLYVPVSLKRYGLSDVVNHLLNKEDDAAAIPFDFLIDGVLLRTSVEDYLTKNGLSNEAYLNLEYTRAVLPPSFLASFNNDDWISSLDTLNSTSARQLGGYKILKPRILAGSYDGIVRTYTMTGAVDKQFVGHSGSIRAVKWISPTKIASAGNDRQIRLWKTSGDNVQEEIHDDDEPEDGKTLAILEGHKAPIVSLAIEGRSSRILSAGYDSVIGLWSTNVKDMTAIEVLDYDSNVISSASKKRKKMAILDATTKRRSPLSLLEGHAQPVEDVIFDHGDSTVAYSVSQDHTIKTWDLYTSRCVDTRSTGYSLLSVLQLPAKNLLVSGSSARHINVHDPRVSATTTEQTSNVKLVGHSNFVVDLSASPNNDNMFASASHDGTVKVWDVRAEKSLYTIVRQEKGQDKVFSVCWDNEIGIISGGEDKKVQINKGSDIAK